MYNELGITTEHHGLSHDEPGDQPKMHDDHDVHHGEARRRSSRSCKETTEGDGNLLDRCAILASSDVSEGQPHSINDYPIIVAGRPAARSCTRASTTARASGENTSKVLLSLLQAMDLDIAEYGNGGGKTNQNLAAILT